MNKINIQRLSEEQIESRSIRQWPIWEKEISTFDWTYEADEECLILEGEVKVKTSDGDYFISVGDFVSFPKGLTCVWEVNKPIRKHYNFK